MAIVRKEAPEPRLQTEDREKLKNLILYIARKVQDDGYERFGTLKLNKVLFFADMYAYLQHGQSITGGDYQKQPLGPTLRRLLPVQEEMKQEGTFAEQEVQVIDYKERRPIALKEPDLSLFSGWEIALVDEVMRTFRTPNTDTVSEISHRFAGWRVVEVGDSIPYEAIFISREQPEEPVLAYGADLAADYN